MIRPWITDEKVVNYDKAWITDERAVNYDKAMDN